MEIIKIFSYYDEIILFFEKTYKKFFEFKRKSICKYSSNKSKFNGVKTNNHSIIKKREKICRRII